MSEKPLYIFWEYLLPQISCSWPEIWSKKFFFQMSLIRISWWVKTHCPLHIAMNRINLTEFSRIKIIFIYLFLHRLRIQNCYVLFLNEPLVRQHGSKRIILCPFLSEFCKRKVIWRAKSSESLKKGRNQNTHLFNSVSFHTRNNHSPESPKIPVFKNFVHLHGK